MKGLFCLLVFYCSILSENCFSQNFAAATIPDSLKKKAYAVIRMSETTFEYISESNTNYALHNVVTILDEKGKEDAVLFIAYSKFKEVSSITGTLYDSEGNKVRTLKSSEIQDFGSTGEENLADDVRYKRHEFSCFNYPYTVEYNISIKYNSSFFFPTWVPQNATDLSVEKSSITLNLPLDYPLHYKAFNLNIAPEISEVKNRKYYKWQVENLPAKKTEDYSPEWEYTTESILFAPHSFQLGKYSGSMETWSEFGKFIYDLNKDRDKLQATTVAKIHSITDPLPDQRSKVLALYKYMQKSTRYVSVQMGIGGWQTAEASFVAKSGYGDCKALVNYMYSLLKEAGITSCRALVKAGQNAHTFHADFPSNQFNHVILCVPLEHDSVWLECTDPNLPGGYLSGFTSDRYCLLLTENGGKLVRTPKYELQENVQQRKIKANFLEGADLQTSIQTIYSGLQQDNLFSIIHNINKERVTKKLKEELEFPTYELDSFYFDEKSENIPTIEEKLFLRVKNYASVSGKRLFILPNIYTRSNRKLSNEDKRLNPIIFRNEYLDIDSVEIIIPSGFIAEHIPADQKLSSPFGTYTTHTSILTDRIWYTRRMTYLSGEFPAAQYAELQNWYSGIYKNDREKVVLVKKE